MRDALRLVVRWAVKRWAARLIVWALMPTRRELLAFVKRVMGDAPPGQPSAKGAERPRNTIH